LDDAMGSALRALEHARQHHERGNEAWTLRLIGEILARRDPPDVDKASDSYRQAMALAEELGMRPLTAHCLLGLATLLGHVGKAHEAREHLSAAATLFGDMDMKFWLERATAAQGQTP
jgi:tetratricopeptide (TPR) repeat protein